MPAAADTVLAVADDIMVVEKVRDGVAGERFGFRLEAIDLGQDSDGDPVGTCVVVPTEAEIRPVRRSRPLPGAAQVALRALREAIEEHGEKLPGSSTIPPGVQAVRVEMWRRQFRVRYGSDERGDRALRSAFQRARETLLARQLAVMSDPYVWLP